MCLALSEATQRWLKFIPALTRFRFPSFATEQNTPPLPSLERVVLCRYKGYSCFLWLLSAYIACGVLVSCKAEQMLLQFSP